MLPLVGWVVWRWVYRKFLIFLEMGRILGIDYGDKRIGLSISDPDHTMAVARGFIENTADQELEGYFRQTIEESDIERLVFGLPLHLSGEESESSMKVRDFAERMSAALAIEVDFQDERFTTQQSARPLRMEKKKHRETKGLRDQGAAVLILQTYLDRKANSR